MIFDQRLAPLAYAVRFAVVAKCFGQLCFGLACLTVVPLVVALGFQDFDIAARYAVVAVALAGIGLLTGRLPAASSLQVNEALLVAASIFVVASLLMTYPLTGAGLPLIDAFFEAVSGVTTTGLTTLATVEAHSATFLFGRAWLQWYGGLGIVVLSIALVMRPGTVTRQLAGSQIEPTDIVGSTKAHAWRSLLVYVTLTGACLLALLALGVEPLPALLQTLTAVSTGGFSTYDSSLAAIPSWSARLTLMFFALAGAMSFSLLWLLHRWRSWRAVAGSVELRGLLVACLATATLLGALLTARDGMAISDSWRHALLLGVSAQTVTGFSSLPVADLDPATKLVLMMSMFIGGGTDSTAGGVKILRVLIALRVIQLIFVRTRLPPHAVAEPRLAEERLEHPEIERALVLVVLFGVVVALSWLPFLAFGYDPLDALFEVVSATATGGLTTGVSSPSLEPSLKLVLCFDMLLGRLEVVALLVALYPGTWFGRRAKG